MPDDMDFRVGDVLSIACPFAETRVESLKWDYLALPWPWWRPDPDSEFHHWNGIVALGLDAKTRVWHETEIFRTDPAPEFLEPGDACRVGVPPTVVHVTAVDHFDPPQETGWLPRPRLSLSVLRRGLSYREFPPESHLDGYGHEVHPDNGIPFAFDLLFRPYAFLRPGDEVADTAGRAWRFDGPWDWYAYDRDETTRTPRWPLTLLTRAATPCTPEAASTVAAATATGSHDETLAHWTGLTDATPASPDGGAKNRSRSVA